MNYPLNSQKALDLVSKNLGIRAIQIGNDTKVVSPFAYEAKKHGLKFTGGKLDDTTVIISYVYSQETFN